MATQILAKKFLTPREVAAIYGFSVGTLANWRSRRMGPKFYKCGKRKVLYSVEDVEDFIRTNPVLTTAILNYCL